MVDPRQHSLIADDTQVPTHSLKNFVLMSKVLNDITHSALDKYQDSKEMTECITRNHTAMANGIAALLV
jgi:hypothetical protein